MATPDPGGSGEGTSASSAAEIKSKQYVCTLCELDYRHVNDLCHHMFNIHGMKVYKCETCSELFYSEQELQKHDKIAHEGMKRHFCKFCPRSYKDPKQLETHVEHKHNIEDMIACTKCGQEFYNKLACKLHLSLHHKPNRVYYKCSKCTRSFKYKKFLMQHLEFDHTSKGKKKALEYMKSLQINDDYTEDAKSCKVCKIKYKSSIDLIHHLRLDHKKIKKFSCCQCKEGVFFSRASLGIHLRYEHGLLNHSCDKCPAAKYPHQYKPLKTPIAKKISSCLKDRKKPKSDDPLMFFFNKKAPKIQLNNVIDNKAPWVNRFIKENIPEDLNLKNVNDEELNNLRHNIKTAFNILSTVPPSKLKASVPTESFNSGTTRNVLGNNVSLLAMLFPNSKLNSPSSVLSIETINKKKNKKVVPLKASDVPNVSMNDNSVVTVEPDDTQMKSSCVSNTNHMAGSLSCESNYIDEIPKSPNKRNSFTNSQSHNNNKKKRKHEKNFDKTTEKNNFSLEANKNDSVHSRLNNPSIVSPSLKVNKIKVKDFSKSEISVDPAERVVKNKEQNEKPSESINLNVDIPTPTSPDTETTSEDSKLKSLETNNEITRDDEMVKSKTDCLNQEKMCDAELKTSNTKHAFHSDFFDSNLNTNAKTKISNKIEVAVPLRIDKFNQNEPLSEDSHTNEIASSTPIVTKSISRKLGQHEKNCNLNKSSSIADDDIPIINNQNTSVEFTKESIHSNVCQQSINCLTESLIVGCLDSNLKELNLESTNVSMIPCHFNNDISENKNKNTIEQTEKEQCELLKKVSLNISTRVLRNRFIQPKNSVDSESHCEKQLHSKEFASSSLLTVDVNSSDSVSAETFFSTLKLTCTPKTSPQVQQDVDHNTAKQNFDDTNIEEQRNKNCEIEKLKIIKNKKGHIQYETSNYNVPASKESTKSQLSDKKNDLDPKKKSYHTESKSRSPIHVSHSIDSINQRNKTIRKKKSESLLKHDLKTKEIVIKLTDIAKGKNSKFISNTNNASNSDPACNILQESTKELSVPIQKSNILQDSTQSTSDSEKALDHKNLSQSEINEIVQLKRSDFGCQTKSCNSNIRLKQRSPKNKDYQSYSTKSQSTKIIVKNKNDIKGQQQKDLIENNQESSAPVILKTKEIILKRQDLPFHIINKETDCSMPKCVEVSPIKTPRKIKSPNRCQSNFESKKIEINKLSTSNEKTKTIGLKNKIPYAIKRVQINNDKYKIVKKLCFDDSTKITQILKNSSKAVCSSAAQNPIQKPPTRTEHSKTVLIEKKNVKLMLPNKDSKPINIPDSITITKKSPSKTVIVLPPLNKSVSSICSRNNKDQNKSRISNTQRVCSKLTNSHSTFSKKKEGKGSVKVLNIPLKNLIAVKKFTERQNNINSVTRGIKSKVNVESVINTAYNADIEGAIPSFVLTNQLQNETKTNFNNTVKVIDSSSNDTSIINKTNSENSSLKNTSPCEEMYELQVDNDFCCLETNNEAEGELDVDSLDVANYIDIETTNSPSQSLVGSPVNLQLQYNCIFCQTKFLNEISLLNHLTEFHLQDEKNEQMLYKCNTCSFACRLKENLKTHIESEHPAVKIDCQMCNKEFSTKDELDAHNCVNAQKIPAGKETNEGGNEFSAVEALMKLSQQNILTDLKGHKKIKCDICNVTFRNGLLLYHHNQKHHKETYGFSCDHCNKTFSKLSSLTNHKCKSKPQLFCRRCLITFPDIESILLHKRKVHNLGSLKCSFCCTYFKSKTNLMKHMSTKHSQNPIPDELIEKQSKHLDMSETINLKNTIYDDLKLIKQTTHNELQLSDSEKVEKQIVEGSKSNIIEKQDSKESEKDAGKHKCDMCAKFFEKFDELQEHLSTHKRRFYKCLKCSKKFSQKMLLLKHIKIVHKVETSKLHRCNECSAVFKFKDKLHQHYKLKHSKPDASTVSVNENVGIEEVSKQTASATQDNGMYKCTQCGALLPSDGSLQRHMQWEHAKVHKCGICDEVLSTAEEFLKHLMYGHANEKIREVVPENTLKWKRHLAHKHERQTE